MGGLLFFRDALLPSEPAIELYRLTGRRTASLYPIQDLVDTRVRKIAFWDATTTPTGGIGLLGIIHRTGGLSHVLMIYDSTGTLRKVWDVYPYHHHAVAVTDTGSVIAFGHYLRKWSEDYGALTEYSEEGAVSRVLLTRDTILQLISGTKTPIDSPESFDALLDGGDSRVFVRGDRILVILPAAGTVLTGSVSTGSFAVTTDLSVISQNVASRYKYRTSAFRDWAVDANGHLLARLFLRSNDNQRVTGIIVRLLNDGNWEPISGLLPWDTGTLVGVLDSGALAFLNRATATLLLHSPRAQR